MTDGQTEIAEQQDHELRHFRDQDGRGVDSLVRSIAYSLSEAARQIERAETVLFELEQRIGGVTQK